MRKLLLQRAKAPKLKLLPQKNLLMDALKPETELTRQRKDQKVKRCIPDQEAASTTLTKKEIRFILRTSFRF